LGKKAHISHGATVTLLLPHVMEFNLLGNPAKFARIAELMGEDIIGLSVSEAAAETVETVKRLITDLEMPQRLSEISGVSVTEADIPALVEGVHGRFGPFINETNPRDVNPEDTTWIYTIII